MDAGISNLKASVTPLQAVVDLVINQTVVRVRSLPKVGSTVMSEIAGNVATSVGRYRANSHLTDLLICCFEFRQLRVALHHSALLGVYRSDQEET